MLLLSVEEVDEHIREVVEMQKTLNEASQKAEFHAHHMEIEHADAIKAIGTHYTALHCTSMHCSALHSSLCLCRTCC